MIRIKGTQYLIPMIIVFAVAFNPPAAQAKESDEQNQIILLNDSAAALEDSNPGFSKRLAKLADEKEKEWEYGNAHKDALPTPLTDKNIPPLQDEIKLLKAAALVIEPAYPLIAQGLKKMADGINKTIELRGHNT